MQELLSKPGVWDDQARGQRLTTELARLNDAIERHAQLVNQLDDIVAADQLLSAEDDPELAAELRQKLEALDARLDKVELASLLSGEYDGHDAVASLHAGAGGVDSQDWTEMLLRMYLRWAERERLQAELDEVLPGEEAGVKSATFTVKGPNAYGLLSAERGVHRLVRLSPYDQAHRRHTDSRESAVGLAATLDDPGARANLAMQGSIALHQIAPDESRAAKDKDSHV